MIVINVPHGLHARRSPEDRRKALRSRADGSARIREAQEVITKTRADRASRRWPSTARRTHRAGSGGVESQHGKARHRRRGSHARPGIDPAIQGCCQVEHGDRFFEKRSCSRLFKQSPRSRIEETDRDIDQQTRHPGQAFLRFCRGIGNRRIERAELAVHRSRSASSSRSIASRSDWLRPTSSRRFAMPS